VRSPDDMIDRGIGVYRLWGMPFRPELIGVDREVIEEGNATRVIYHTPVGDVSTKTVFNEEMRKAGISISWIAEHAIKRPEDYRVLGYIFRNIKVHADYENYLEYHRKVGEKGLAVAFGHNAGSPMHHILKQFMDATRFYLDLYDHPKEMEALCQDMDPFFEQIFNTVADSPAEVIFFGGNYDNMITYPAFFRQHIMPHMQRFADKLHPAGKLLLSHCDGENTGLLDLLPESGMDIAEAVCPAPMTKFTVAQMRAAFRGKVTIWGGIPSIALLESTMSDDEFDRYLENLFREVAPGDRFILGVSDTTPPDAKFDRLLRIGEFVRERGRLPLKA
jgi:hypothetical protein